MLFDKYFEYLKDISLYEATENNNKWVLNTKCDTSLKCPECNSDIIVRNGSKHKKIQDIPFQEKPVLLDIKHQRWTCKECASCFGSPIRFIENSHNITKRLFDYIVLRTLDDSALTVSNETGVSKRNIHNIINEYYDSNIYEKIPETIFITYRKIKGYYKYIVLDGKSIGTIRIIDTISDLKYFLINYTTKKHIKSIFVDCDKSLLKELESIRLPVQIKIDYRSYVRYVNHSTFELYKKCRKQIEKNITTSLSTENKYFILDKNILNLDEYGILMNLFDMNTLYYDFYSMRDEIIDKNTLMLSIYSIASSLSYKPHVSSPAIAKLMTLYFDELSSIRNICFDIEELSDDWYTDTEKMIGEMTKDFGKINNKMLLIKYQQYPNTRLDEMKIAMKKMIQDIQKGK